MVSSVDISTLTTLQEVMLEFAVMIPSYFKEVITILIPVFGVFVVFQLLTKNFKRLQVLRILVGFLYTLLGTTLFLTGVNVGFAPVGTLLGQQLATETWKWILLPVGALIGYYIVKAEPAVQILNKQVEDVTSGTITARAMNTCLSIGVSAAVLLSMLRILTGLDIYWIIIPGYLIALILCQFVQPIFVGIAFDAGGVASGPMTSTFLLPMAIGACTGVGGNIMTDAFGVIALVAMAPIIAVLIMGVMYESRLKRETGSVVVVVDEDDLIIEIEED
ncbi:MAG: DUF1538 domain-containing protein [Lachnospiraceae bacterium]|nr:DUF1538 domain-containing protein [Lachnospiraceae bacterium]